jgi:hypothetical protein
MGGGATAAAAGTARMSENHKRAAKARSSILISLRDGIDAVESSRITQRYHGGRLRNLKGAVTERSRLSFGPRGGIHGTGAVACWPVAMAVSSYLDVCIAFRT